MNLREICKERLLTDMIRAVIPTGATSWKVLIVDQESMRIISACCRMFDIMEENVTVVEKIDIARQPLPHLEAIYFITPTHHSVDLFLEDYKKKGGPLYSAAHLFFTSRLPDDVFQKMQGSVAATKIRTLKELNMEFLPYEAQVFHFDQPEALRVFFSPEAQSDPHDLQQKVAQKLVSVLATLGEYPVIRYSKRHPLANTIASLVQDKIDHLARHAKGWSPNLEERAELLILDRTQDPIAPILHEFTYQAMVYDLLDVQNDKYTYNFVTNTGMQQRKEVILGETDILWPVLRHLHIADTINFVIDNFNEFVRNNKTSKALASGGQVQSLKDMADAMRSMPQYQEMLAKYSLHINLANAAMSIFTERRLERTGSIEQDMATGEDADGKTIKNVISSLAPILSDPTVSKPDKLRLIMLYIISQEGIKDSDRKRLVEMAQITNLEQSAISNLFYLGVTLAKGSKSKRKLLEGKRKKKRGEDVPYELSRYTPVLKEIGEELIDGTLSAADFPFLKEDQFSSEPSKRASVQDKLALKSKQPRWADKDKGKKKEDPKDKFVGGKVILFIIGGMTLSEMRSAYELTQSRKRMVFIGSTHVLKPKDFLDDLASLKKLETA